MYIEKKQNWFIASHSVINTATFFKNFFYYHGCVLPRMSLRTTALKLLTVGKGVLFIYRVSEITIVKSESRRKKTRWNSKQFQTYVVYFFCKSAITANNYEARMVKRYSNKRALHPKAFNRLIANLKNF